VCRILFAMTRPSLIACVFALIAIAMPGTPRAHGAAGRAGSVTDEFVTYRLLDGDIYKLEALTGGQPLDVSAALNRLSHGGGDQWLNTSPNGRWLLTSTERFGCRGWACLARVDGSISAGGALRTAAGVIHADGFSAISSDGRTVVFPQGGGPHTRDLWMTHLAARRWSSPRVITGTSRDAYNTQPAISADGREVLFDCGPGLAGDPGTTICEVSTSGGAVTKAVAPSDGPGGSARNEVHHADFAPGGGIVFEADWRGEQIWRTTLGSRRPLLVSRVHDDNSPCVLPDGRIVSLYLDRPGNANGVHEVRVANADGSHGREILIDRDVLDVGIGCGGGVADVAPAQALADHPRIFLDPATLARLRARADGGDPAWRELRARCDEYRPNLVQWPDGENYPDAGGIGAGYQGDGYFPALLDVGLCYRIAQTIDPGRAAAYGAVGAAVLEHMSALSGPHFPNTLRDDGYGVRFYASGMAIGYDWLYPVLSPSLRARVAAAIERWLRDFERAGFERNFPQGNYFAGYYAAKAYAGLALAGDSPDGKALLNDWLHRVHDQLVQPYYAANLSGGGWPEGWNYGPLGAINMSLPTLAARTALGADLVDAASHPYVYPVMNPRFLLYFAWPDMTTMEDSSALYSGTNPSVAAPWLWTTEAGLLDALGDRFAPFFHSYAAAARQAQPGGQLGPDWDLWENLLFWDDRAPERSYRTLPLSYYARGIEMAAVRSDWSRGAVWGAFKSGPYINYPDNGEEYFDEGSLAIVNGSRPLLVNANGALLRDTPGTNDGDAYWQPIYDDLFSDGGNRDIFSILYVNRPAQRGQDNRLRREGARTRIAQFEDGGSYVLMAGTHLEDEYPRSGTPTISSWTRTVVYLRPRTFIVFDRTSVTDPGLDQWLSFHLGGRPLAAPAGGGGARRYDVVGRTGYAGSVDTVLPLDHADTVAGLFGSSKVFRLEVRPGHPGREQQWLTVFDAARSRSGAFAAEPLSASGEPAGVLLRSAAGNEAVLVGGNDPALVRYRLPSGPALNLLTGLKPGSRYDVHLDGGSIEVRPGTGARASAAGVLEFRTA
jgi:hypothetical protein